MTYKSQTLEDWSIPMPITQKAQQFAEQFAKEQPTQLRAEQVYLNTLAVCAVNNYLQILGIPTDLTAGDSWNPLVRLATNVADLWVTGLGRLECRPVRILAKEVKADQTPDNPMRFRFFSPKSQQQVCYIPSEVQFGRIGYVVVQIDEEQQEATLLGFTKTADQKELPFNQLRPLEDLLLHLSELKQPQERVHLSQWLMNAFDAGWETIEALLKLPTEPAWAFRRSSYRGTSSLENSADGVRRGKLLGLERSGEQVALLVELKPTAESELNISVEVYPLSGQIYLPQDLQLMVLDDAGKAVMQAIARNTKNIQLKFSGEPGERFGVRVALGNVNIIEPFLI